MRLSAPVFRLKRDAKKLARDRSVPLHVALDEVAVREGFRSWSHMMAARPVATLAAQVRAGIAPGSLVVLAARPGQGKTRLGLELTQAAVRAGQRGWFFTLDYTRRDVATLLDEGEATECTVDTSDEICAAHILASTGDAGRGDVIVIDFLQLLDQKRVHPPLQEQLEDLKRHAQATGAIIAAISQVDRRFDAETGDVPGFDDLRKPNPVDLSLFDRGWFLYGGEARLLHTA